MAEQLKRDYDIVVLKIELHYVTRLQAELHFTFQYHRQDTLVDDGVWVVPIRFPSERDDASAGSSSAHGGDVFNVGHLRAWEAFDVPGDMLEHMRKWILRGNDHAVPLWIHLVKPYGPLRLVYWESVFHRELGVPVLMLPDFIFPKPREDDSVLEVALCASAPPSLTRGGAEHIARIIGAIDAGPDKRVTIHVFADPEISRSLGDLSDGDRKQVRIYEADANRHRHVDRSGTWLEEATGLRSPWLRWMADTLKSSSIDVAHFVCHGYLADDKGALVLAPAPVPDDSPCQSNAIGRTELKTFLTRIGAWSSVFTPMPGNKSNFGLRVIADDIAQSRPGPMMLHYLGRDEECEALRQGYGFLYGRRAIRPPLSNALLIYCQPYLLAAADGERVGDTERLTRSGTFSRNVGQQSSIEHAMDPSPVMDYLFGSGEATPLIASTERFAEQTRLKYQQLSRDELLESESSKRTMAVALDTLHKLQMAVAAHSIPSMKTLEQAVTLDELIASDGALSAGGAEDGEPGTSATFLSASQLESLYKGETR